MFNVISGNASRSTYQTERQFLFRGKLERCISWEISSAHFALELTGITVFMLPTT